MLIMRHFLYGIQKKTEKNTVSMLQEDVIAMQPTLGFNQHRTQHVIVFKQHRIQHVSSLAQIYVSYFISSCVIADELTLDQR